MSQADGVGKTACKVDGMNTAGFLAAMDNAKFAYNARDQVWEANFERRRIQYAPGTSTSPTTIDCLTTVSAEYRNGTTPD